VDALVAHGPAILFYVFGALAVVAALGVVALKNPMYGAISLLVTFLSVAVLFVLRQAEFLAVVQVLVYGGGIMVLFLFVIMLINLHRLGEARTYWAQSPAALVLALVLTAGFVYLFVHVAFGPPYAHPEVFRSVAGSDLGNPQAVAWSLYRDYLLPFEIASLFLLVAMIGAVVLGRRE